MSDSSFDSQRLQGCVERWQQGDRTAADEMLRALGGRLEHLADKMMRSYPAVRTWVQTEDVLQGALLRALQELRPASTREFFNLAAVQLRRELLDLARRLAVRNREGPIAAMDSLQESSWSPADPAPPREELERWQHFHAAIEQLPAEEREVVSLAYYHGWTQAQIAELFGVTERTIRRRWTWACAKLQEALGGDDPSVLDAG